jgi:histone acetyltransferase (RNA polymerase elongator complex component)
MGENAKNAEIAFFGGSFTAIERTLMVSLLEAAYPFTQNGGFKGIRLSTRPDAIDDEILSILKHYNVKAIELGAQSMDDGVLSLNRRGHSADDIVAASKLIKEWGFELGLQMMTGLYGSTEEKDIETAKKIAALEPKTVRIYPTITLEGTALCEYFKKGLYTPPSLEASVQLCAKLLMFFEEKNIAVIRLGLHAMPSIEKNYAAGPWHPAFRELCQSVIYFDKAHKEFESAYKNGTDEVVLFVANGEVSKLCGQHRKNLIALEKEFNVNIKIREKEMPKYCVELLNR